MKIILFLLWKSLDRIESEYLQLSVKAVKWITKPDLNRSQSSANQEANMLVNLFMFWQTPFPLVDERTPFFNRTEMLEASV